MAETYQQAEVIEASRDEAAELAVGELTQRERLFVLEYVNCWNIRKAALRTGLSPATARVYGYTMMKRPAVQQAIQEFLETRITSAAMVVDRLVEIATGDFTEFLTHDPERNRVTVDLAKAYREGATGLIKKIRMTKGSVEVELHDPLKALELLARHLGMLNDRQTIAFDWRTEASEAGLNPEELREQVKVMVMKQLGPTEASSE